MAVARPAKHRHSGIAHALWRSVINSEYRLTLEASWLAACGGARGNPAFDQTEVNGMLDKVRLDALSAIPYWTGGRTGAAVAAASRDSAMAEYLQLKPTLDALAAAKSAGSLARTTTPDGVRKLQL